METVTFGVECMPQPLEFPGPSYRSCLPFDLNGCGRLTICANGEQEMCGEPGYNHAPELGISFYIWRRYKLIPNFGLMMLCSLVAIGAGVIAAIFQGKKK